MKRNDSIGVPQIKICGLTDVGQAEACIQLGAHAVGCVFYPPSPRHTTAKQAGQIARSVHALNGSVVGVFVNEPFGMIMKAVTKCRLDAVQLHGRESPQLVAKLAREKLPVIKVLFLNASPAFADIQAYQASAYLAECSGGPLPGGNALDWDWGAAVVISKGQPLILAGGLNSQNVGRAITAARPDAVDVSSGVEARPGKKDLEKVRQFISAVRRRGGYGPIRRILQ